MKNQIDIAIVIAVYNGEKTLKKCLSSIESQTDSPTQLIIIDGNSTDNTKSIIEAYNHIVSYAVSEKDKGIYDAWNKGIKEVRAKWTMFLGADDILAQPETLKSLARFLAEQDSETQLIYGIIDYIDSEQKIVESRGQEWCHLQARMKYEMSLPHPGMLHKTTLFEKYGIFNTNYRIAGDYDLIRRVCGAHTPKFIPETIVLAGVGGISTRPQMIVKSILETGQVIITAGEKRSLDWYLLLLKGVIKYVLLQVISQKQLNYIQNIPTQYSARSQNAHTSNP